MSQDIKDVETTIFETLSNIIVEQWNQFAPFIAGIIFGAILSFLYHRFVGRKSVI